jgi:hypothetical protein
MGQIIFHCVHCGAKLCGGSEEAGEEFECPECNRLQVVPGGAPKGTTVRQTEFGASPEPKTDSGMPVVRIPKRKIVLPAPSDEAEDEDEENEAIGGQGLGLFAVALGTAGMILCGISMIWMFIAQRMGDTNWWVSLIVFITTFLMGLMGLVLAQLSRLVVRLADRVERLGMDEDQR